MPERVRDHTPVRPRKRLLVEGGGVAGYFFPGEVAKMLQLDDVNYRLLRQLYVLARSQAARPVREGWSRYDLLDLAALEAIVRLYGGPTFLCQSGRRVNLRGLRAACQRLLVSGYENPLVQVPLVKEGSSILALVDGVVIDAVTMQVVIDSAMQSAARFLGGPALFPQDLTRAIDLERERAALMRASAQALTAPRASLV